SRRGLARLANRSVGGGGAAAQDRQLRRSPALCLATGLRAALPRQPAAGAGACVPVGPHRRRDGDADERHARHADPVAGRREIGIPAGRGDRHRQPARVHRTHDPRGDGIDAAGGDGSEAGSHGRAKEVVMLEYKYSQQRGSVQEAASTPTAHNLHAIPRDVLRQVPAAIAHTHKVVPVAADGETLTLATDRPGDIALRDKLTFLLNRKILLTLASRHELLAALDRYYGIWVEQQVADLKSDLSGNELEDFAEYELALEEGPHRLERRSRPAKVKIGMHGLDLDKMIEASGMP